MTPNLNGKTRSPEYLFILSHMRSRSTLLAHVLGSNLEVDGYTELHQSYISELDLKRMNKAINKSIDSPSTGRYRLDKILYNCHLLSPRLLDRIRPSVIFLLRPPAETFNSLVALGNSQPYRKRYTHPKWILKYYLRRLRKLEKLSALDSLRGFYLDSENLIEHTDHTLQTLTRWLQLEKPLQPNYDHFRYTGAIYKGDPSENIRAGKILAQTSTAQYGFPSEIIDIANERYQTTRQILRTNCNAIHDPDACSRSVSFAQTASV